MLEAGDMLYLPPGWAHDGIAQGECMTCSIGFRVPEGTDLAREVLIRWMEGMDTIDKPRLYQDPKQAATSTPGLIPRCLATVHGRRRGAPDEGSRRPANRPWVKS